MSLDSHLALPHDNRSLNEILKVDALPYQLNSTLSMASIMPAHLTVTPLPWLPFLGLMTTGRPISPAAAQASSAEVQRRQRPGAGARVW
ncbi:hypothetical protein [Mycobacterium tuberculosis]|uniref:hypothetical protein n=1 Tax=Mycobacterium tuberculosis TaxID=1773 RepID=UPI00272ACDE0|nr:hypothetical protein [Mycobacterium tuberculosis]